MKQAWGHRSCPQCWKGKRLRWGWLVVVAWLALAVLVFMVLGAWWRRSTPPVVDEGSAHIVGTTTLDQLHRPYVDPKKYMLEIPDEEMRNAKAAVDKYIASPQFKARQEYIAQNPDEKYGILVSAGGRANLVTLIIQLKTLREKHKCTLPVEVAWHGKEEMDEATWAALESTYGPLYGFNIQKRSYPPHQRNIETKLKGWVGKVYALLHTRFQHVLLLDSDSIPLRDPTYLFDSPLYKQHGNLFWPDYWWNWIKPAAWKMLGLNAHVAKSVIDRGRGFVKRDGESGQLLIDRTRHLDALEYAFFINTFSDKLYDVAVHGDKDTYALGFAIAGKAHLYSQISMPPGGAFRYVSDFLESKEDKNKVFPGYQLLAMLQYDHFGQPIFYHRTMEKYDVNRDLVPLQLVVGPIPRRWLRYHIAHDSIGPLKKRHGAHTAPHDAFRIMQVNPDLPIVVADGTVWGPRQAAEPPACSLKKYALYTELHSLALPIDRNETLERACRGCSAAVSFDIKWQHKNGDDEVMQDAHAARRDVLLSEEYLEGLVFTDEGVEVGTESPIPGLLIADGLESAFIDGIHAADAAYGWIKENKQMFSIIDKGI